MLKVKCEKSFMQGLDYALTILAEENVKMFEELGFTYTNITKRLIDAIPGEIEQRVMDRLQDDKWTDTNFPQPHIQFEVKE